MFSSSKITHQELLDRLAEIGVKPAERGMPWRREFSIRTFRGDIVSWRVKRKSGAIKDVVAYFILKTRNFNMAIDAINCILSLTPWFGHGLNAQLQLVSREKWGVWVRRQGAFEGPGEIVTDPVLVNMIADYRIRGMAAMDGIIGDYILDLELTNLQEGFADDRA